MPKSYTKPRLALVYDRANTNMGGAERLLTALAQEWGPVDLFTTVASPQARWLDAFRSVKTSFINYLPGAQSHHQFYEPLAPLAFESFDFSTYDIVVSISSSQSQAILTRPHQLHLHYLLTPPRYLYRYRQAYLGKNPSWNALLLRYLSAPARAYLKWFNQQSIFRPDIIVPLSQLVRRRALRTYPQIKLEKPLYPFAVNLTQLLPSAKRRQARLTARLKSLNFNLSVSRLVKYKRVELAMKASLNTHQPLVVVGTGVEQGRLLKLSQAQGTRFYTQPNWSETKLTDQLAQWLDHQFKAGKQIFFLGNVPDTVLSLLYHFSQVVISVGLEDFGLVPLEAGFFGTPSIINQASGVAEVLIHRQHTWQLAQPTQAKLTHLLRNRSYRQLKPNLIKQRARTFSRKSYLQKFTRLVYDSWQEKVSYKV